MGYPNIYHMTYIQRQKWEISDDVQTDRQTDRQTDTARVYLNRLGSGGLPSANAKLLYGFMGVSRNYFFYWKKLVFLH